MCVAGAGKKRAEWDVKGRLADLEFGMSDQLRQNETLCSRIQELEAQKRHLEGAVVQKEEQTTAVSLEVEQLRNNLRLLSAPRFSASIFVCITYFKRTKFSCGRNSRIFHTCKVY